MMTLFTVGCNINSSEENSTEIIDDKIVSVEEFMEYYGVKETDIPREYILDYIMHYILATGS